MVSGTDGSELRALLASGVDWTAFTRRALAQGLAGLTAAALGRVAPQLVPGELLDAFSVARENARRSNEALLGELAVLGEALGPLEAIVLKGPVFAQAAYGDLGFRACGNLELLVRQSDRAAALAVVRELGYEHVRLHTQLVSRAPASELDCAGLWQRAHRTAKEARGLLVLSAEDTLLALALEGDREQWANLRRACDVAALVGSQPRLNWNALIERARAHRSLHALMLGTSLARRYFHCALPPQVLAAERADPATEACTARVLARWNGEPAETGSRPAPMQAVAAWLHRAEALFAQQRFAQAAAASERALAIDPEHIAAQRMGIRARIFAYDWSQRDAESRLITTGLKSGRPVISPDNHRVMGYSEEENHIAAQLHGRRFPAQEPLWRGERYRHKRIRIAYKSTDFRVHPVGNCLVGCFEHHDKAGFETFAISLRKGDASEVRRRIEAAFDHFIDAEDMSDEQIAQLMRDSEIDILVDLNGYASFGGAGRTGVLARRPVPVQVNYFGYCGTLGLPYVDYIIADRTVIPEEHRIHYSERVVHLPDTYWPTDRAAPAPNRTPTRAQVGLPPTGFVFVCHNNTFKIRPDIFDVWMRLLRATEASALWLLEDNPRAAANLRRQAAARGVDPERLVFAPLRPHEEYLARLRLADLCVDTLPYNAHTTACDALWMGVPVVTCRGETFPARVATSLLRAIGLPELVTESLADYEALALALARDPARLAAIKAKLVRNRDTEPLFDTARFTRHLEAAYRAMWERQQAGLPPAGFAVGAMKAPQPGA